MVHRNIVLYMIKHLPEIFNNKCEKKKKKIVNFFRIFYTKKFAKRYDFRQPLLYKK